MSDSHDSSGDYYSSSYSSEDAVDDSNVAVRFSSEDTSEHHVDEPNVEDSKEEEKSEIEVKPEEITESKGDIRKESSIPVLMKLIKSNPITTDGTQPISESNTNVFETTLDTASVIDEKDDEESLERLETAYKNLIEKGIVPEDDLHAAINHMLNTDTLEALHTEDYDKAESLHKALRLLGKSIEESEDSRRKQDKQMNIEDRLKQAESLLDDEEKEWEQVFNSFKGERKLRQKALEDKLSNEEEELNDKWSQPEMAIPFNKPSPMLLQLRRIQKTLALSKRFDQAKQVKQQADALQQKESSEAEKRFLSAYQAAHSRLMEKQKREKECFEEHEKRIELFLLSEREKATKPYSMQIKQLQNTKTSEQPLNRKPIKPVFSSSFKTRSLGSERGLPPKTPRTSRAYNQFRSNEEPPKLDIPTLNIKKVVAMRRSATSIRVSRVSKNQ